MSLDSTDIRILEHLERDGRASLRKLAEELGISPSTASNRFHALQERGIIKGFRPVIDYEAAGFGLTALIDVNAEANRMETVADTIRNQDRVVSFFETTGETDMVIVCKFLDREDMNRFVKRMQKEDGVKDTKTNVVLTSPKEWGRVDLKAVRDHGAGAGE